jgi:hypothetical protein
VERAWFEKLGGFTEDYVFGHYEDADLCLKSLQAGEPAWVHDLRMWHLEGKGSHKMPQHVGGSLLNRWLFSRRWETTIVPEIVGRMPRHRLFQDQSDEPAASGAAAARPKATPPTVPATLSKEPKQPPRTAALKVAVSHVPPAHSQSTTPASTAGLRTSPAPPVTAANRAAGRGMRPRSC